MIGTDFRDAALAVAESVKLMNAELRTQRICKINEQRLKQKIMPADY